MVHALPVAERKTMINEVIATKNTSVALGTVWEKVLKTPEGRHFDEGPEWQDDGDEHIEPDDYDDLPAYTDALQKIQMNRTNLEAKYYLAELVESWLK